jgi:hypothetical protein
MAKVAVCFSLDSERDRDLVRWLEGVPRRGRSEAIRNALRGQLSQSGVTLGDIYQAILDLKRQGLVMALQGNDAQTDDEPPDVAATLDGLGL